MAMTNDLRYLVTTRLNSIKTTYNIKEISYRVASENAMYPHIVYDFSSISPTDMGREDFMLDLHIWTKSDYDGFQIMDALRNLFSFRNDPQTAILPTFYEMSGGVIDDPDKTITHLVLRLQTQVYERSTTS